MLNKMKFLLLIIITARPYILIALRQGDGKSNYVGLRIPRSESHKISFFALT